MSRGVARLEMTHTFPAVQVAQARERKEAKVQMTLSQEEKLLEKDEPESLARKYGMAVIIAGTEKPSAELETIYP